jgi:hypothetical protein
MLLTAKYLILDAFSFSTLAFPQASSCFDTHGKGPKDVQPLGAFSTSSSCGVQDHGLRPTVDYIKVPGLAVNPLVDLLGVFGQTIRVSARLSALGTEN